jgi:hypothetical protein
MGKAGCNMIEPSIPRENPAFSRLLFTFSRGTDSLCNNPMPQKTHGRRGEQRRGSGLQSGGVFFELG